MLNNMAELQLSALLDAKFATPRADARRELSEGLLQNPALISPKYFYDNLGSKLFEAICLTPEYYLTRAEASIYATHAQAIADAAGQGRSFIDLGAGNCAKAASLFAAMRPVQYVPIDISLEFLTIATKGLVELYPDIAIMPLGLDFTESLQLPDQVNHAHRLFFYPGSSIGNFSPAQAAQFLGNVHAACGAQGALLIGIDLVKSKSRLEQAYNDQLGITAAFNLNLLLHVNALLGSHFALQDWHHVAFFNEAQSRIEMHLEARQAVTVNWPYGARIFSKGERIHTENSYKYTRDDFFALLEASGFSVTANWFDDAQDFMVCHARAR